MMVIQRHESTTRDPAERGAEIGVRFSRQIAESLDGYWRLFDAKGIDREVARDTACRMLDAVAAWSPSLATELAGLASGAGVEAWEAALMSGRTEIIGLAAPSGGGECSTGVHLPADGSAPRTLQVWDWYTHLAADALAWSYVTDAGRGVHGFTELGILGKIGINDAGVGSHMNMLNHATDGTVLGIPLHLLARRIHDEATTLDEAIEIVRGAPVGASTALTVVSYDGERARAAFLEASPAGVAVIEGAPGETMRRTNHFLDEGLASGERNPDIGDTHGRLAALDARAHAFAELDAAERAAQLVDGFPDGGPVCVFYRDEETPELSCETKATLSLDFDASVLRYAVGTPGAAQDRTWEAI
jgi:isopenicillin-N N-acyltransferase-like protein